MTPPNACLELDCIKMNLLEYLTDIIEKNLEKFYDIFLILEMDLFSFWCVVQLWHTTNLHA